MNMRALRQRLEQIPGAAMEGALVVVVAVATALAMATAPEPSSREPDAFAYGLGLLIAGLLFFRRRRPVAVLLGSATILTLYFQLDYPGFFPGIPLAAAIYTTAAAGRLRWAIAVTALFALSPLIYRTLVDPEPVLRVVNDVVGDTVQLAAFILLGEAVRSRRAYAAEVTEKLERAEAERERVAEELKMAHLVQQQFLPDELPELPGWHVAAFYRSAREVEGTSMTSLRYPEARSGSLSAM